MARKASHKAVCSVVWDTFGLIYYYLQLLLLICKMQCAAVYAINILPVQKDLLIVSVMELPIDWALPVTLLSIRQQLVEHVPTPLACSSTAAQFDQAGWA